MAFATANPNVILVCGPSPQALGGGPTHMRNLWDSPLSRLFRLEFFRTGSKGRESPAPDEALHATLLRLFVGPIALFVRIVALRPAVVHLNSSLNPRGFWRDASLLAIAKCAGRRVVYQVHGGTLNNFARSPAMRRIARFVFGFSDSIVVLSTALRDEFLALGGVRRVDFVPNAIEVAHLGAFPALTRSGRVQRLGYLGRLVDGKGLEQAIEAVAILRSERPFADLEFRVAGSGDSRARLEECTRQHGVSGAVRFVGTVSGSAKEAFLKETDVLVLPSRSEGMPYSILEAMAVGTPVVASAVGGIVDVIRDGIDGRVIPPENSAALVEVLRELAADPDAVLRMSTAAATRASAEFSLDRLAMRFAAVYSALGAEPSDQNS